MALSRGLVTALNSIREASVNTGKIYHQYIPILDENSDISKLSEPLFTVPEVYNEFCSALVQRIVYTQVEAKMFRNPLSGLEDSLTPMGYAGQDIYINPAKGRQYNVDDFAGILQKYESDVKVQYLVKNADYQYPVTIVRSKLKEAFVSWDAFEKYVNGLTQSLYNGMYINQYRLTKALVSSAYKGNKAIIESISTVSDAATAAAFTEKARELFLNFQSPSTDYNAWSKNDGYGRPITTWTNPEDIIIIIKNNVRAKLDVALLANSFQIEQAQLLGQIYTVDNFDVIDDDGVKIFDGSAIVGMIADRSWFKIKKVDSWMDSDPNPNNRSIQFYLNDIHSYEFSLFANGVIFATATPENVPYTSLSYGDVTEVEIEEGDTEGLDLIALPTRANAEISYETASALVATVEKSSTDERHCTVTAVGEGSTTLTVKSGDVSTSVTIKVVSA